MTQSPPVTPNDIAQLAEIRRRDPGEALRIAEQSARQAAAPTRPEVRRP